MKTSHGILAILGIVLIVLTIIFGIKLMIFLALKEVMSLLLTMPALGLAVIALMEWTFKHIYKATH